ncbi:MAG: hypothetical protein HY644_03560 [Acidobacteria bacterium]|nr:hypothetical protein [Acidobacteriota bacterium]
MRNVVFGVVIGTLCFGWMTLFAVDTSKTGILIDMECCKRIKADPKEAAKHEVSCALKDACAKNGFGLIADGKFLKFDKDGDSTALDFLKKTKRTDNMVVTVTGDFEGKTVSVAKIEDAAQ